MNDIDFRVLAVLADNPRGALFRDEEEKLSLQAMTLYIDRPVSDVYELPGGELTGRITDAGRRALRQRCDCGSAADGKWADRHEPTCATIRRSR